MTFIILQWWRGVANIQDSYQVLREEEDNAKISVGKTVYNTIWADKLPSQHNMENEQERIRSWKMRLANWQPSNLYSRESPAAMGRAVMKRLAIAFPKDEAFFLPF